eukprot:358374-Chlamydomonas_euryale.AAC.10
MTCGATSGMTRGATCAIMSSFRGVCRKFAPRIGWTLGVQVKGGEEDEAGGRREVRSKCEKGARPGAEGREARPEAEGRRDLRQKEETGGARQRARTVQVSARLGRTVCAQGLLEIVNFGRPSPFTTTAADGHGNNHQPYTTSAPDNHSVRTCEANVVSARPHVHAISRSVAAGLRPALRASLHQHALVGNVPAARTDDECVNGVQLQLPIAAAGARLVAQGRVTHGGSHDTHSEGRRVHASRHGRHSHQSRGTKGASSRAPEAAMRASMDALHILNRQRVQRRRMHNQACECTWALPPRHETTEAASDACSMLSRAAQLAWPCNTACVSRAFRVL